MVSFPGADEQHLKVPSPALRRPDWSWALQAEYKANLFADTFASKWSLLSILVNYFSAIVAYLPVDAPMLPALRRGKACVALKALRTDSGAGPDLLPTKILKFCARELALHGPFCGLELGPGAVSPLDLPPTQEKVCA